MKNLIDAKCVTIHYYNYSPFHRNINYVKKFVIVPCRFFIYKLNKNVRRGVLSCCSVGVIMQVQMLLEPFLSFRC